MQKLMDDNSSSYWFSGELIEILQVDKRQEFVKKS